MFASIQQNKINSAVLFTYLIRTLMMPWWFVPENNCWLWPRVLTIWPSPWWSFPSSFLTNQFQSLWALSTCTAMLPLQSMAFNVTILFVSRHWQQLLMPYSTTFPLRQLSTSAPLGVLGSATFAFAPSLCLQLLSPGWLAAPWHLGCEEILPAKKKHNKALCEF